MAVAEGKERSPRQEEAIKINKMKTCRAGVSDPAVIVGVMADERRRDPGITRQNLGIR